MWYRSSLLVAVAFFSQYAGNFVAGYFATTVTKYFGITSPSANVGLTIVTGVISFISSQLGAAYVDRLVCFLFFLFVLTFHVSNVSLKGRRPMLIWGTIIFSICYAFIIALLWYYNNEESKIASAIIACKSTLN
jgi:MFS family permease